MFGILVSVLATVLVGGGQTRGEEAGGSLSHESLSGWQFFEEIRLPDAGQSPWVDVVLPPSVFDAARHDLADLRLYDPSGSETPYALRVRREEYRKDTREAKEFNRAQGPKNSTELSLDLGGDAAEHNEVEVQMPGTNFRRRAQLEGSDDGDNWRQLVEENLITFHAGKEKIEDRSLGYPPCRFRYLRIRVFPDPEVDKKPVDVGTVTVGRRVEVPGEMLKLPGKLGPREPVRKARANASAWIISLGADNVPCEEIEVEIKDSQFVRDYRVEAGGPPDSDQPFRTAGSGRWRRRAGAPPIPMKAKFTEVRASRLRLIVIDHGNDPLDIRSVNFIAPARQVVFARPEKPEHVFRLYLGNPKAEAPHYDFAGNLPRRLDPSPLRAELNPPKENPAYEPEPLPFTERWPWAIYVVLGSVSVVLGVIILNVAGTAIAVHDSEEAPSDTDVNSSASPFAGDEEDQGT